MTAFVLVHGSGQNADSWSRVGALLAAKGHQVVKPELPKRAPEVRLEQHAAIIAESIPGPGCVLVGHSMSGAFLPLVPRIPGTDDCALLVFLAAVIPEPGKSIRQQFTEDPTMFNPEWIAVGSRWFDPTQQEQLGREFLFHDCDEESLPWALRGLEPIDTSELVTQSSPFERWPEVATASIVASGDRTLAPEWGRRITRRLLGQEALEVEAGHCPQVSMPEQIADLLERLAARNPGASMAERIVLRDVEEADLPILFEHQREPAANRMAAFAPRDRQAFMAHWREKILADESVIRKTVLCDERVAGNIVCYERSGRRLIGYWIGESFWGRGIATRALAAFLGQVAERPLHAYVARRNPGSIRVLEKCGFQLIGEDRSSPGSGGDPVQELVFSLGGSERP